MSEWLFNTPVWLLVALAGLGLALLYHGNLRRERPVMLAGITLLLAAVVLMVLSVLVTTDREHVSRQADRLVRAVRDRDFSTFAGVMDESVQMKAVVTLYPGRSEFVNGARSTLDSIGLRTVRVLGMELRPAGADRFEVFINALSEQDIAPYPMTTSWRLDFARRGEEWLVVGVEALVGRDGQVTPDRIRERMVRP